MIRKLEDNKAIEGKKLYDPYNMPLAFPNGINWRYVDALIKRKESWAGRRFIKISAKRKGR